MMAEMKAPELFSFNGDGHRHEPVAQIHLRVSTNFFTLTIRFLSAMMLTGKSTLRSRLFREDSDCCRGGSGGPEEMLLELRSSAVDG